MSANPALWVVSCYDCYFREFFKGGTDLPVCEITGKNLPDKHWLKPPKGHHPQTGALYEKVTLK